MVIISSGHGRAAGWPDKPYKHKKKAREGDACHALNVRSLPLGKHDKYLRRDTFFSRNIGISLVWVRFALGEAINAGILGNG